VEIKRHPEAEKILEKHYGKEELNAARLKMAEIPVGAKLIYNPVSAAPGFIIENVFVMAGVPRIMQAMFASLKGELKGGEKTLSKTISAYITEGVIAEKLTEVQNDFPDVEIGSYPFIRHGKLGTSLVSRSTNAALLETCYNALKTMLIGFTKEIEEGEL
jgi:molybdopterin-biosynthesis enzyme MoeA-like protein